MAQKAIAIGEDEPFDYVLAAELGWSHGAVQELPHDEYVRWRAFFEYRRASYEHDQKVAGMRAR